jgi:hypothetical protein
MLPINNNLEGSHMVRRKRRTKKAQTQSKDNTGMYMLVIIGLVAAVAVVAGFGSGTNTDLAGHAVAMDSTTVTYTEWTNCLDQGNEVKLGNDEGSSLSKQDLCTGSADKQITRVSCVEDVDGGFTYKYANAEDCPESLACVEDDDGAAYCG